MTSLLIGRPSLSRMAVLCSALVLLASVSASADQIRVLLVMPAESGRLARQVSRFEDALRRSSGGVVRAQSLLDADAVVQFTSYRRLLPAGGKSQDWWYGQYKLLTATGEGDRAQASIKPFAFVVGDCEDWQVERALDLLGATLARALGWPPQPSKGDAK